MTKNEKGVALLITLFLMAALSSLAVSMMFLAQTETSASRNYKTMSQARYAGEAGIHKAINYMLNSYTVPSSTSGYGITVSPVTCANGTGSCIGGDVILAAPGSGKTSNYPDATVASAFASAATGTLTVGTGLGAGSVTYTAYAKLLNMRSETVYGGATGIVQTWEITATGNFTAIGSTVPATVEVTAILERDTVPAETFAVFATSDQCGAVNYSGSGGTDSFDSTSMTLSGGVPVTQSYGGAIGTNGNLYVGGSVVVNGTLSTPRSGVGACSSGSVTAFSGPGSAPNGGTIQLPQAKSYPTPTIPANTSATDLTFTSAMTELACQAILDTAATAAGTTAWTCGKSGSTFTITPPSSGVPLFLRNVTLGSNVNLTIAGTGAETVNFNTFSANGNTNLSVTNTSTIMNITGAGVSAGGDVVDLQGNFSTTVFDPSKLQILYAGTNEIKLRGNNELAATIYAPNSHVDMSSAYDVYGSILAATYTNSGGAKVHYDRSLSAKYVTLGNYVMSSFSWKKYY